MDEPEGEPADILEILGRDNPNLVRARNRDDSRLFARWRVWRQEAVERWGRVIANLWAWRRLTSFAGSILNAAKGRHRIGRIALGEETVNARQYAGAVGESRWQSAADIRRGRINPDLGWDA